MLPSSEVVGFLADLKTHLNITKTNHDAELVDTLEAAFELAEAVAGRAFYRSTTTELLPASGVLRHYPVATVHSAVYMGVDYTPSVVVSSAGVVSGAHTGTAITYTYGQQAPTAAQRRGVLIIAEHAWDSQRGQASNPLQDAGEVSQVPGFGFALPNMARDYLRPPGVTSGIA